MKKLVIVLALCALSACATTTNQGQIKPEETTEQFVTRIITSGNGGTGY